MHYIFPVAYCVLNPDKDKCEHIAYGVEDAPKDADLLYDQYGVEELYNTIDMLKEEIAQLHSHIVSLTQPEVTAQATEALPEYKKIVYVKVKGKNKMEVHSYVNSIEEDNATIIANVRKDMKEAKIDVENVFVVEKR